ncbi:hypothetical protein FRC11_007342 [Ceratobasidium sp. 423]|nr:hypothetical protein FRC11_007342 [Ceratobasidium sp. 423]
MSGALLGTAFGAMQIVYAAHRDVKSNRENCTALVHRAEIVMEELKLLASHQAQGEEMITERIGSLLSAFETTAQVIRQIGHKNWLRALLDADHDAIHIEHCHRCLTDLMFLFNIEQGLDQRNLQQENERARQRDHDNLLQVAESVQSELTTQGEIIDEVLEMVRTLSRSPTFNVPAHGASQTSMTSHTYHGASSPGTRRAVPAPPAASKSRPITRERIDRGGPKRYSDTTAPQTQRRRSWMNKLGFQKIAAVRISIPSMGTLYSIKARRMSLSKPVRAKNTAMLASSPPECKSDNSKSPTKGVPNGNIGGNAGRPSPERGRKGTPRQPEAARTILPATQLDCVLEARRDSRLPLTSPRGLKHVEVRYYSGNMASGVLLSEFFGTF